MTDQDVDSADRESTEDTDGSEDTDGQPDEEWDREQFENRVVELEAQLTELEAENEDLEERLARKQADFQNYKRRQKQQLAQEKERATEDLVERLLDVRDNLERALEQDEDVDIRDGVESTLEQFDQQLARENVERITATVGEVPDPHRHEVLATIASTQPANTIAQVHRPGYLMGEKVLRSAQVAVSDGSLAEEDESTADNEESATEDDSTTESEDSTTDGEESTSEDEK